MANPAFQLIADRFSGGAFGVTAFGTTPFGGPDYRPYVLPIAQVPSDDLSDTTRRKAARVRHERYGVPIGMRTAEIRLSWTVSYNAITKDVIDELAAFFEVGKFRLIPDSDFDSFIEVEWVDDEFSPKRLRGPYWDIRFNIMEAGQ